ncbi:ribonuclease PH [bacterium]|nr:ribonuclease PH [bacterium]
MKRSEGRKTDELRSLEIIPHWTENPDGSALVKWGKTWVLCTACCEGRAPYWQKEKQEGWVTAEYGMLPGSTDTRKRRPGLGKVDSRGTEIQRLVARSLRGACNLKAIPSWTVAIDCDVLQADGGTRVASVVGGMVALEFAARTLVKRGALTSTSKLIKRRVVAVSLGWVDGEPLLDLDYAEDKRADVDLNLVGTADGSWVEVQGTAEGDPVERTILDALLDVGFVGLKRVGRVVAEALRQ